MATEMVLSRLMEINYKPIEKAARLITRRMNNCPYELINETYLVMNKMKVPEVNQEFIKVFVRNMKLLYIRKNSPYRKNLRDVGVTLEYEPINQEFEDIYLIADGVEELKDEISGLSHLTKEKVNKYCDLMMFKSSLAPWDSAFFEMVFEKGMSTRDIAEHMAQEFPGCKSSHSYYSKFIKQIKEKIKIKFNNE